MIGETNAGAVVVALASAAFGMAGCFIGKYQPQSLPPCVSGYQDGDRLAVRIGDVYDAASDYIFEDGSTGPAAWENVRSCAGQDGLATGSVVTFTLTAPADGNGGTCSPWLADFQPEIVANPELARDYVVVRYTQGVTIADASVYGSYTGKATFASRALYTPSGNPQGALVRAQLPPLVFTRGLSIGDLGQCFDAWLATWGPAP